MELSILTLCKFLFSFVEINRSDSGRIIERKDDSGQDHGIGTRGGDVLGVDPGQDGNVQNAAGILCREICAQIQGEPVGSDW